MGEKISLQKYINYFGISRWHHGCGRSHRGLRYTTRWVNSRTVSEHSTVCLKKKDMIKLNYKKWKLFYLSLYILCRLYAKALFKNMDSERYKIYTVFSRQICRLHYVRHQALLNLFSRFFYNFIKNFLFNNFLKNFPLLIS